MLYQISVAAIPAGSQLTASNTNISIDVNFKTTKVLMVKAGSSYEFALSEVEFYNEYNGNLASNKCKNLDLYTNFSHRPE